ncbi:unnamed protein product [Echinostoma caproni]|uniref:Transposase n=1 Tax=Echinostoma caproni TaxID=27848 RepID=A0A183AQS5_9TREM|nr:unnamed protein product [Echinostoma caproni]
MPEANRDTPVPGASERLIPKALHLDKRPVTNEPVLCRYNTVKDKQIRAHTVNNNEAEKRMHKASTEQHISTDQITAAYERALKRYGWRLEIPGDPLKLKRNVLAHRPSYFVPLKTQVTLSKMPVMHASFVEPFFQRTIPNRPLSFAIHPDWASEAFVAKQCSLRSNAQWDFGVHRYAFAY